MKLQHHVDSPPRGRESHRLYRMYSVLEIASRKIFLNEYNVSVYLCRLLWP